MEKEAVGLYERGRKYMSLVSHGEPSRCFNASRRDPPVLKFLLLQHLQLSYHLHTYHPTHHVRPTHAHGV
jgi:hypothetical protein